MNSSPVPFRIGVLAPSSNFVPFLAGDLLKAIKFGLEEAHFKAELIIESAGYNADNFMIVPKVQQLILAQQVSCLIAPLNVALIEKLGRHCEGQGIPLIALNLTEDPLFETAQNPYTFVNSFHLWHAAWMSGYLAAQRFGPRGATAVALHDGGYGLAFAFQLGMEAAQGALVHAVVTHRNSSQEDPTAEIAALAASNPDFIWAGYSGKEAASFLTAYHTSDLKHKIPLIGLAPLVTTNVRKTAGAATKGVWFVTSDPQNIDAYQTIDSLTQAIGRPPNPYAVLGYEAAHLIAAASKIADQAEDFLPEFPAALRQVEFNGCRGMIRFDNSEVSNLHFSLRQVTTETDTIESADAPPQLYQQYQLACQRLTKQGWVNPYLCA